MLAGARAVVAKTLKAAFACLLHLKLGTDFPQRLWGHMVQPLQNIWDQGFNIFHPIAFRYHDEDGNWQCGKILLGLDILVGCQKHFELRGGQRQ